MSTPRVENVRPRAFVEQPRGPVTGRWTPEPGEHPQRRREGLGATKRASDALILARRDRG